MRVTKCRSVSFMVNIPVELSIAIDKYLNERRFETRSELIIEAVQTWIDCEEDDDFWEIAQKHDRVAGTMSRMRENKRKKISNKPICTACGAVITVRCEAWHNRLGRCLRHSYHTGPHYFAAKSIQDDPTFWDALQDPWTVVYFPEPEKLGKE